MQIRVTKWEAQRLIDILRCREVPQSQHEWADELATQIESARGKLLSSNTKQRRSRNEPKGDNANFRGDSIGAIIEDAFRK